MNSTILTRNMNHYNLIDVRQNHKQIVENMFKQYYEIEDTNHGNLAPYFTFNCQIVYQDNEFIGFSNFFNSLLNNGIFSITHYHVALNSQALNDRTILVMASGIITYNHSSNMHHFSETFILERDNLNNLFITNHIFRTS